LQNEQGLVDSKHKKYTTKLVKTCEKGGQNIHVYYIIAQILPSICHKFAHTKIDHIFTTMQYLPTQNSTKFTMTEAKISLNYP